MSPAPTCWWRSRSPVTPDDAWDLVDTATRLKRQLLISFGWNYQPMMRAAKALMDDHGVGQIEQFMLHMGSATRELLLGTGAYPDASPETTPDSREVERSSSLGRWLRHGATHSRARRGSLADRASGLRSLCLHVRSARRARRVARRGGASLRGWGDRHDGRGIGARQRGGNNKHQLEMRVIGSEGQFQIDLEREALWLFGAPDTNFRPELAPERAGLYDCVGPPHALVDLSLGHDGRNCSPGWLGARTVEILDACYRSPARSASIATIDTSGH